MRKFNVDSLVVKVADSRVAMGKEAAKDAANKINELLKVKQEINMIFAAAPSQNEFLAALISNETIDWTKINAFHMDEYLGLDDKHPALFGNFLRRSIFDQVPFKKIFYLNRSGQTTTEIIKNYSALLDQYPTDIVCMGIGENTHIAFNDPHVAQFNDPVLAKEIKLDEKSRMQQVHDECFDHIKEVPETAITLTIPALLRAKYIYCIVPGENKAEAVVHTLKEQILERFPSTILRNHPHAILYLDQESASELDYSYV